MRPRASPLDAWRDHPVGTARLERPDWDRPVRTPGGSQNGPVEDRRTPVSGPGAATALVGFTPAGSLGNVPVVVTTPGGSTTVAGGYTYV